MIRKPQKDSRKGNSQRYNLKGNKKRHILHKMATHIVHVGVGGEGVWGETVSPSQRGLGYGLWGDGGDGGGCGDAIVCNTSNMEQKVKQGE